MIAPTFIGNDSSVERERQAADYTDYADGAKQRFLMRHPRNPCNPRLVFLFPTSAKLLSGPAPDAAPDDSHAEEDGGPRRVFLHTCRRSSCRRWSEARW